MRPKAPVRFFFGAASAKYALNSAIWNRRTAAAVRELRGRIAPRNCARARLEAEAGDEASHRHLRERRRGGEERVARGRDEERERDHRAPADVVRERAEQRREHRLGRPERRLQQAVRGGRRAGVGDQEGQHRHEHGVRRLREQDDRVRPAEERERRALARVPRLHRAERDVDRDGHPYLLRRRVGLVVVVHDAGELLATRSATGCSERKRRREAPPAAARHSSSPIRDAIWPGSRRDGEVLHPPRRPPSSGSTTARSSPRRRTGRQSSSSPPPSGTSSSSRRPTAAWRCSSTRRLHVHPPPWARSRRRPRTTSSCSAL